MLLFSQHFPRYRGALPVCVNMLDLSLGSSAAMFQMMDCPVADLEGDRGGSRPPHFGCRTDAVTVLLISENGTVLLWRVLKFDRSSVKRALQNTQIQRSQAP